MLPAGAPTMVLALVAALCLSSAIAASIPAEASPERLAGVMAAGSAAELASKRLMRREDRGAGEEHDEDENGATDPYAGKVKDGFCSNWQEGSTVRDLGEGSSYFGPKNTLTQEQCWGNCDNDRACEQAVYDASTQECWLGINAMVADPGGNKCTTCINTCYAKNGFGYKLALDVKDGWCSDFAEGWGGARPTQCSLESNSVVGQQQCSHWGAEYALSERGCWTKCQLNAHCKQAVYENKANSWACYIGTNAMLNDPPTTPFKGSRCHDCNNRCYAKLGFGKGVAAAAPADAPAPANTTAA